MLNAQLSLPLVAGCKSTPRTQEAPPLPLIPIISLASPKPLNPSLASNNAGLTDIHRAAEAALENIDVFDGDSE